MNILAYVHYKSILYLKFSVLESVPDRYAGVYLRLLLSFQHPESSIRHGFMLNLSRIEIYRSYESAAFFYLPAEVIEPQKTSPAYYRIDPA